ncbi:alpha/beta hydrolase [Flavobacterium pallidum]|uniref:Esterase n=1 Tax=Flavobacterium pallidum TaxID=2172098 RepID=A0A2S1SIX3_9FLAO|nr:alpha/beta hydrolase-fold protein [Flavobacterium pallidum]AWI26331.1 esterase [Flavobacterium pallidum]
MKSTAKTVLHIFLLMAFTFRTAAQTESKPLTIGSTEQFKSAILAETRTINVYLPEGFNPADTITYPLICIPDGGIEEDFIHITGIVRFNTQPWINRFPKSIVIGIENTNRKRDFTFAVPNLNFLENVGYKKESIPFYGGSPKYILFLEKELLPYIKSKYKATRQRTIIGESLAGLLTTEILLKNPDLFDTYIIISPSLWWGDEKLLKDGGSLLKTNLKKRVRVCVSAPNQEEDKMMYREATSLYDLIKQNPHITSFFDYLPEEWHATVMHMAVYNAFKLLYPKTGY